MQKYGIFKFIHVVNYLRRTEFSIESLKRRHCYRAEAFAYKRQFLKEEREQLSFSLSNVSDESSGVVY